MKKSYFIAVLALASTLAACDEPATVVVPVEEGETPPDVQDDIDECPRADGQPCN